MHLIASDTNQDAARILDGFECPAILVTNDYRILATNERYLESFGEIEPGRPAHCFEVSHGYDRPCDQAGETCPLATCTDSRKKSGFCISTIHLGEGICGRGNATHPGR